MAMALDKVTEWAGRERGRAGGRGRGRADRGHERARRPPGVPDPALDRVRCSLGPRASARRGCPAPSRAPSGDGGDPASLVLATVAASNPVADAGRPRVELRIDEAGPILSERTSREVLAAYGIPLVPGEVAASAEDAVAAAERLGYPVVVKADVKGVAHKAAAGLVELGVASEEGMRTTFAEMQERMTEMGADSARRPGPGDGPRSRADLRHAPRSGFGPVILVGAGGLSPRSFATSPFGCARRPRRISKRCWRNAAPAGCQ